MMEIIPTTKSSVSRQDIETVEPYKKELRLIARKKRVPGHTLFSYNTLSGEIKPAER